MIRHRHDSSSSLPAPHAPALASGEAEFPRPAVAARPFVSVLVPVRNEARNIGSTLLQLLEQRYDARRFEVIVADGESTDETRDVVRELQSRHPNLHLVSNPGVWSSAGRNAALELSRGEIVVVVDGHCDLANPDYLANLVSAFERSGADCVGRPQPLDVTGATTLQRAIAAARSSRLGHHPDSFIYSTAEQFVRPQSVAIAYRREVFAAIGPFDESFDACEDVEFNHRVDRAGLRCFFSPSVAVRYHPRADLKGLLRQMVRYGRGRVRLLRKHRETFSLSGFAPALFVLGLLVGPLFAVTAEFMAWTFLGCLALYALLVLSVSANIARQERDARMLFWCPLVFPTIHVGAGAGILLEWLRPGKRPAPSVRAADRPETQPVRRAA